MGAVAEGEDLRFHPVASHSTSVFIAAHLSSCIYAANQGLITAYRGGHTKLLLKLRCSGYRVHSLVTTNG